MILHTPLAISVVAVATTATFVFIGLGHLPRPTRATAIWSGAFASAMLGAFLWIGGDPIESTPLRGIGNGLLFGAMLLVWSGVRSFRGVEPKVIVSGTLLFAMPLLLLAFAYTDFYAIAFRGFNAVIAVFAGLTIIELLKLGSTVRDEILPLLIVCALYMVFAVIAIIDGVMVAMGLTTGGESFQFIRGVNFIGANIMLVCALVTLLQLATRDSTIRTSATSDVFESVARDRLKRAKTAGDPWWSFIDIRLDDPDDIRISTSTAMFNEVSNWFIQEIYASLPPDADIQRMSPTRVVALVPRAQGSMREILSELLRRISTSQTNDELPVRLSASIGWAHAPIADYNFDVLLGITANATRVAHDAGGDRWERVQGDD